MTVQSLTSLLVQETKAAIYAKALGLATAAGLPVSSWQAGDPTRSLYHLESEVLSALESVVAGFISSGFLDYAKGVWLKIKAKQDFNVDVPEATYATTDVVLTNGGGGYYEFDAGSITVKSTVSGKTYRNSTGGTLPVGPGTTLTVTVVADEAGSDSSASAGEIDDFVTGPPAGSGVTCTNPTAAIGVDEQDESTTIQQCKDKLDSLSPNGAKGAYAYVARNSALTGTSGITDARTFGASETGDVTVYLRGPSGAVSEADRALAEAAILYRCTPVCITPTVLSASNVVVPITYQLWIYKAVNKTADEIEEEIEEALEQLFASHPIGGDIIPPALTGNLYLSLIESTIRSVFDEAFRVIVSLPAGATALSNGQVAALGTITATINLVDR